MVADVVSEGKVGGFSSVAKSEGLSGGTKSVVAQERFGFLYGSKRSSSGSKSPSPTR
jgi:hypothetical protein